MSAQKVSAFSLFVALNIFVIALAAPINYFMGPKKLSDDEIVVVGPLSFHKVLYQVQEFDFSHAKSFAAKDNQTLIDLADTPAEKWLGLFSDMIDIIANMNNADIYVDKIDMGDVFYVPFMFVIVYRGKVKHFKEGEKTQPKMLSLIKSAVDDIWQLVEQNKVDEATLKELTASVKDFNGIVKELESGSKKINFTELMNNFNGDVEENDGSSDNSTGFGSLMIGDFLSDNNLTLVETSEYGKPLANAREDEAPTTEKKKTSTGENDADETDKDDAKVNSPKANDVKEVEEENKSSVETKIPIKVIQDDDVIDLTDEDGEEEKSDLVIIKTSRTHE